MPNIKEIVLKAGHSTVPAYWLSDEKPIACSTSNFEKLVSFAEALVTELAKQNEPVAWMCSDVALIQAGYSKFSNRCEGAWSIPVFTFPPTAEQIANETAEACASYLSSRAKPNLEAAQVMDDTVYAIRSGAWKEFKK